MQIISDLQLDSQIIIIIIIMIMFRTVQKGTINGILLTHHCANNFYCLRHADLRPFVVN